MNLLITLMYAVICSTACVTSSDTKSRVADFSPGDTVSFLPTTIRPDVEPSGDRQKPAQLTKADQSPADPNSSRDSKPISSSIGKESHQSVMLGQDIMQYLNTFESQQKERVGEAEEDRVVAPFGTWSSPITSDVVFTSQNKIVEPPKVDRVTGHVFWVEQLTSENGIGAVYQYDVNTEDTRRWTGSNVDVRSRVHEYGGGSFLVHGDSLFYSNAKDGNIYRQDGVEGSPVRVTNGTNRRYADGTYSPKTKKLYYVCEDHSNVKEGESPKNFIVEVDLVTGRERTLIDYSDFFASPRISDDGEQLIWLQWNHPNMPWDKTELYVANVATNGGTTLTYQKYLQNLSMMMPSWNQHNELLYVHEMTSWWNLYIINRNGAELNLTPMNVEVGWPTWKLGTMAYDSNPAIGKHEVVVIVGKKIQTVNTVTQQTKEIPTAFDAFLRGIVYSNDGNKAYTIAASNTSLPSLVEIDLQSGSTRHLRGGTACSGVREEFISSSTQIQFPTTDDMFAYGHFYPPKNPKFTSPTGSLPPLIVRTHKVPTMTASTYINMAYQYFTSRGFAILDVDHRGSTGYGRYYRDLLIHKWGVYDNADLVAGADYLVKGNLVDPKLVFVDGEFLAGFTALSALTSSDRFLAGASYYAITNRTFLTGITHKFESHYLQALMGDPHSQKQMYEDRSPINNAVKITTPVIFLQWKEDEVNPIEQTKVFFTHLKNKAIPTDMVEFEGESHGFSKRVNKKEALERQLQFFVEIGNLNSTNIS